MADHKLRELLEQPGANMSRMELNVLRRILRNQEPFDEHIMLELTKTEREEFMAKLNEREQINFDLDLSTAKEPEFFEELYRKSAEG